MPDLDPADLIRVLRADDPARAELRRLLLGEDLDVPQALATLADAQRGTEQRLGQLVDQVSGLAARTEHLADGQIQLTQRIDQLADNMSRFTQRMDQLAAGQIQLTQRMDQLTQRMDQLAERMDQLADTMSQLAVRVDGLAERMDRLADGMTAMAARTAGLSERLDAHRGWTIERKYVDKGHTYFQRIARRLRVLSPRELDEVLDPLVNAGTLTDDEAEEVRAADAVFRGRLRRGEADGYLVVEVSVTVDNEDVYRASQRAQLLLRSGRPALPVVAGEGVTGRATRAARDRGVWQVTNGTVTSPDDPSPAALSLV